MKTFTVLFLVLLFSFTLNATTYTSTASGNWSTMTWSPAGTPGPSDDVIIGAGHIVAVDDANAVCNNISFGDATAQLDMSTSSSVLSVYGNFTPFSTSHVPFSVWTDGAILKFTGSAATQTISNIRSNNTVTDMAFFKSIVVDKSTGKVTYSPAGSVLNISNSLEIISGTFEVPSTNDINGRSFIGTSEAYPTITVQSGGVFDMLGGASHIAARAVPSTLNRIGKVTIYGTMNVVTTSTNKINFGNVDIENGGILRAMTGWSTTNLNLFNPGTIEVKSGGTLRMSTTTDIWDATTVVNLNSGGYLNVTASGAPVIPPTFNNNGTVRYSLNGAQIVNGITFKDLWLEDSGVKTLGGNTIVNGTLSMRGAASLSLSTYTLSYGPAGTLQYGTSGQVTAQTTSNAEWPTSSGPQNVQVYNSGGVTLHDDRTIPGTLTLTLGQFDNNGSSDDKTLSLADGATISRARGTLSAAPNFGSSVNLRYTSSIEHVTSGVEMPASSSVLNDLSIQTTQGISLGADVTVNGTLEITNSSITLGSYNLTLAGGASISGSPSATNMIIADGSGELRKEFSGTGSFTFPVGDNTGTAEYSPVTLNFTSGTFSPGAYAGVKLVDAAHPNFLGTPADYITRYWTINQNGISSFSCDVTVNYLDADVVGSNENNIEFWKYDGGWSNPTLPSTDIINNKMTGTVSSFSDFTGSDNGALPVELSTFTISVIKNSAILKWTTNSEINSSTFEVQRKSESSEWKKVGEVIAAGNSNSPKEYSFTDRNLSSAKYQYRLKMIDADGSHKYSSVVDAEIQLPKEYAISQNYPNPFNPSTRIDYELPFDSKVTIELYGISGEKIATLVNGYQSAGYYTTELNAGKLNLSSGAYIYRMIADSQDNTVQTFTQVKKLLLTK